MSVTPVTVATVLSLLIGTVKFVPGFMLNIGDSLPLISIVKFSVEVVEPLVSVIIPVWVIESCWFPGIVFFTFIRAFDPSSILSSWIIVLAESLDALSK